jgi:hypothetical protein
MLDQAGENMSLTIHIFLAFAGELDPKDGRSFPEAMERELHQLNSDPEFDGINLVLHHWKLTATIGLNPHGPQGQIDPWIRRSDILIFAFGRQLGVGIQHEIEVALDKTKQRHQHIAFYFPEDPPQPRDSEEAENTVIFHKTRGRLWTLGLAGSYRNVDDLIHRASTNLRRQVRELMISESAKRERELTVFGQQTDQLLIGREKSLRALKRRLSFNSTLSLRRWV